MVIFFSKSGITKKYAEALAKVKGDTIFEIEQEKPLGGNFSNALKSVFKREEGVKKTPDLSDEKTIYLCSPVWGGGFPPAMRYFVTHVDMKKKPVKLLLTCNTLSDSYVKEFEKQLTEVGVILSKSIVFSGKKTPLPPLDKLSEF